MTVVKDKSKRRLAKRHQGAYKALDRELPRREGRAERAHSAASGKGLPAQPRLKAEEIDGKKLQTEVCGPIKELLK